MFVQTKVDTLARLVGVVSDDPRRPQINGVHIRSQRGVRGVIVEATNGHIAALEHDAEGTTNGDCVLSPVAIKAIVKAAQAFAKACKARTDDMRVTIDTEGYEFQWGAANAGKAILPPPNRNPFLDIQFPDLARVIPSIAADAKRCTSDAYNAELVVQLAKSAKQSKRHASLGYVLYSPGIGCPARMRVCGAPNWLGVIMPMRVDGDSTAPLAPWETAATSEAKAAA
jgi:hypothetical protein